MLRKRIATAAVVMCLVGLVRSATAQNNTEPFRPFNGLFANLFDDGSSPQQQQQQQQRQYPTPRNYKTVGTAQSNQVPTRANPQDAPQAQSTQAQSTVDPSVPVAGGAVDNYNSAPPVRPPMSITRPQSSTTGKNYSFQYEGLPQSQRTCPGSAPAALPAEQRRGRRRGDSSRGSRGLRRTCRLAAARATEDLPPVAVRRDGRELIVEIESPAACRCGGTRGDRNNGGPAESRRGPARRRAGRCRSAPHQAAAKQGGDAVAAAERTQATAKPAAETAQEPSVLMDRKSPLLSVETIGPRKIVVGKEAAYAVLLKNSGKVAAEDVTVTVTLPDWAEVAGVAPSTGEVHPVEQGHHEPCRWALGRIEARSSEKLALKIIPKQSKPFELAVRWDFKQAASQALIEVQEPKLTMRLDGPREVVFGKREVYKLKLGNSGNGAAENVVLTLQPLNANDTHAITHRLGTLNSGDERAIEVELTRGRPGTSRSASRPRAMAWPMPNWPSTCSFIGPPCKSRWKARPCNSSARRPATRSTSATRATPWPGM